MSSPAVDLKYPISPIARNVTKLSYCTWKDQINTVPCSLQDSARTICSVKGKLSIDNHIVGLVHKNHILRSNTNVSDVPRSLQSWVSTIQTVVLTADVFQHARTIICVNVWCTTQLAKLSSNHSHGRTHSWRFSTFYKKYFEVNAFQSTTGTTSTSQFFL